MGLLNHDTIIKNIARMASKIKNGERKMIVAGSYGKTNGKVKTVAQKKGK